MSEEKHAELLDRVAELEAFKDEWAPYLIQLNQALVAILNMAMPMLPPGMVPPQVKSFMRSTLGE